jgi:hypothetical protein
MFLHFTPKYKGNPLSGGENGSRYNFNKYGLDNENKMLFIPYGRMVIAPVTLVHAGGFWSSLSGNKCLHFSIYCGKKGAEKDPFPKI